ncbi:MAG: hypothetical protein KA154_19335 [Gemmatimonadaceae bacterium]|nr:hypothetical protein [Gemmatimonadaceae bacterium]
MVSKSQIDRLGERLKAGQFSEGDLRELDAYRQTFAESYEAVMAAIRQELELTPTGRSAKSTTAIVDKLRRESIRLSQMQDIAGCRIVVGTIRDQQNVVSRLSWLFPQHELIDRRRTPSHGYRESIWSSGSRIVPLRCRFTQRCKIYGPGFRNASLTGWVSNSSTAAVIQVFGVHSMDCPRRSASLRRSIARSSTMSTSEK